jgi:antitoxin component YwqK of YwqJK toxin-antitoxin module
MGNTKLWWCAILAGAAVATGCGSSAGGGGGSSGAVATGGAPGSACNATFQDQGCRAFGTAWTRVQCDPSGVWQALDACAAGDFCSETAQAGSSKHTATCSHPGVADSGGGQDATSGDGASQDVGKSDVGTDASGQDVAVADGTDEGQDITILDDTTVLDSVGKDIGKDTGSDLGKDTGKDTSKDIGKDTGKDSGGTGVCPAGDLEYSDSTSGIHYFYKLVGGQQILQGPYERTGATGILLIQACFDDGGRSGTWTYRFAKGALSGTESFDANHLLTGPFVSYFESGQKEYEGTAIAGDLEGAYTEWAENGMVVLQSTYSGGHLVGKDEGSYDDGSPQFSGTYDDTGLPIGTFTWWAQDGTEEGTATFVNGNAKLSLKNAAGQVFVTGTYTQGKRDGTWTYFYTSGNKAKVAQMNLGSGPVVEFQDVAGLKKSLTYALLDERMNGTYTQYASDGVTVQLTGTLAKGLQVGTWTATNAGTSTSACWVQGVVVHDGDCTSQDATP